MKMNGKKLSQFQFLFYNWTSEIFPFIHLVKQNIFWKIKSCIFYSWGSFKNDVRWFLTILSPHNVRFLPSNVRFLGVISDPPIPPKIGHHLWTLPCPTLLEWVMAIFPLEMVYSLRLSTIWFLERAKSFLWKWQKQFWAFRQF